MEFVEMEDFGDAISYEGDSGGTPLTSSAGVFLSIYTCMYF